MLITLDPDSHRLNITLRRPLLCSAVVLHDEGQAFGGLIGIHCMRNLSIGAVLTAIYRRNKRDGAFVLLGRRIDLRLRRGKAAVDQTVELGLVGRICTDNSDDIFAQSINSVGCGVHRLLLLLPDRVELPLLGLAGELGDGLAALFEVFLALIPAIERIAVPCGNGKFIASLQLILRNSICLAKVCDLRAGLVVDGVVDGVVPVGFDSQVAGRASRNLGDLLSNAVLVQIAAPLQEGLAEHAVLRDRVQRDSLLDRVLLSVFGIKLLIRNVLVAVVVRDRVLDGRVVAVELPLLNLRRRSELFRAFFADVLRILIPAVELIAVRNSGHPQRVGRSLRDRNVFLIQDRPTVAVLFRVSYKEGALLPDGIEGHSGVARVERQLFAGLELFCRIGGNRRRIRTCSPAEELVAHALRNLVAESEDCRLARKLKRLRYGLGHVFNIAPILVVGQGGLADHINLRAVERAGLLPLAFFRVILERPLRILDRRVCQRVALVQSSCLHVACNIKRQPGGTAFLLDGVRSVTVRNTDAMLSVGGALEENAQVGNIKVLLVGRRNLARVNFGRRPLRSIGHSLRDRWRNFGLPACEGVAGVVRVFAAERGGIIAVLEAGEDYSFEELAFNAVGVGDGESAGRRMREIYRHRIARFPSLLARIPRIGNACGVVPQCVVR